MHRDVINFVHVINPFNFSQTLSSSSSSMAPSKSSSSSSSTSDFVITTSVDGHVKFWKKTSSTSVIEFVKHFKAHLGPITASCVSADGSLFASVCPIDKSIKIFDILNFGDKPPA